MHRKTILQQQKRVVQSIKTNLFSFEKITLKGQQHILIPLGDNYIYQYIQNNVAEMKKYNNFWIYDRCKLDLAFQMVNLNVKKLTYITKRQFQTVQAVLKQPKVQFSNYSSLQNKDKVFNFLQTHDFQINKSFMDIHPINSYLMLCRYVGISPSQQIKRFFNDSYSLEQIQVIQPILPFMIKIRKQYLRDTFIKIKKLQRIKQLTQSEFKIIFQHWSQIYGLEKIKQTKFSLISKQEKKQWISKHQYGYPIKLSQLLQNVGRFYCYAQFK